MKKKILLPLSLSTFVLALSGCGGGGESATINEDPYQGVVTTTNGCDVGNTQCQNFIIDYPIEGLNFDCSSVVNKHFVTKIEGNVATGACLTGDKISFYLQGSQSSRKIELGTVDLKQIVPTKIENKAALISLADIAKGMTGKEISNQTMSDDTYKTLVRIIRVFQAIGVKQNEYVAGDVQPISITTNFKNELSKLDANVVVADFLDGTYESDLSPWLNISEVNETVVVQVAKQLGNLSNVNIYSTSFLTLETLVGNLNGFSGSSQTEDSIGNLIALTTRQGYTVGYALQWTGKVDLSNGQTGSLISRMKLVTQVPPKKLNTYSQTGVGGTYLTDIKDWINPFTQKIATPLVLRTNPENNDVMQIYQGKFINQNVIPGNFDVYKSLSGETQAPSDSSTYGKWRQSDSGKQFDGTIDLFKSNPATYLNRDVFLTANNTKAGEVYIFPLYADLKFNFSDSSIEPVQMSIVIDENGDIRTNRSATSLTSNKCLAVNNVMMDSDNVQQYRIGTTGAVNSSSNDKSITLRMILANPIFEKLDGVLVGLNYTDQVFSNEQVGFASDGVRLNLMNLIVDKNTTRGINISGWDNNQTKVAQWGNVYASYQSVFNQENKNAVLSQQQIDLAKRTSGTIEVSLPDCYEVKTK
ncbi:hypothetical protein G9F32_15380 [Acinetobacter sp. 194]|uniref:putative pilus system protein FilF n=1 Tax=Acinetobacter shaoyimingii TaxID=2715164 RepID=UPI00140D880A|nr:hypothetical protein [Acinetobacter shaoyimingii]NHB59379.1 hypothetical protein [Acinetobacter shaoyimingii]